MSILFVVLFGITMQDALPAVRTQNKHQHGGTGGNDGSKRRRTEGKEEEKKAEEGKEEKKEGKEEKKEEKESKVEVPLECTLCLESMDNGAEKITPCIIVNPNGSVVLHQYHKECFDSWKTNYMNVLRAGAAGTVNPVRYRDALAGFTAGTKALCALHAVTLETAANVVDSLSHQFLKLLDRDDLTGDKLIAIVKLFIKNDVDVNAKTAHGFTVLMLASRYGYHEIVKLLLAAGDGKIAALEIDAKNVAGLTPLMLASNNGYPEVVKLLLAAGAERNAKTAELAPLMLASRHGHHEVVKLLLAAGADVSPRTSDGKTLLDLAVAGLKRIKIIAEACVPALSPDQINERTKGMRDVIKFLIDDPRTY